MHEDGNNTIDENDLSDSDKLIENINEWCDGEMDSIGGGESLLTGQGGGAPKYYSVSNSLDLQFSKIKYERRDKLCCVFYNNSS